MKENGIHALVTDSYEIFCNIYRSTFTEAGIQVDVLQSNKEAIELLKNEPKKYDVAIVDLYLEPTGVDFADTVKQIRPNIPVYIMVIDSLLPDLIKTAENLVGDRCMQKTTENIYSLPNRVKRDVLDPQL